MAIRTTTRNLETHQTADKRIVLPFGLTWTTLALLATALLAAGLRLVMAQNFYTNDYYTAAVKNMLRSPSNFFFRHRRRRQCHG